MQKNRTARTIATFIMVLAVLYLIVTVAGPLLVSNGLLGVSWGTGWRGWLTIPMLLVGVLGAISLFVFGAVLYFLTRIDSNMWQIREQGLKPRRRAVEKAGFGVSSRTFDEPTYEAGAPAMAAAMAAATAAVVPDDVAPEAAATIVTDKQFVEPTEVVALSEMNEEERVMDADVARHLDVDVPDAELPQIEFEDLVTPEIIEEEIGPAPLDVVAEPPAATEVPRVDIETWAFETDLSGVEIEDLGSAEIIDEEIAPVSPEIELEELPDQGEPPVLPKVETLEGETELPRFDFEAPALEAEIPAVRVEPPMADADLPSVEMEELGLVTSEDLDMPEAEEQIDVPGFVTVEDLDVQEVEAQLDDVAEIDMGMPEADSTRDAAAVVGAALPDVDLPRPDVEEIDAEPPFSVQEERLDTEPLLASAAPDAATETMAPNIALPVDPQDEIASLRALVAQLSERLASVQGETQTSAPETTPTASPLSEALEPSAAADDEAAQESGVPSRLPGSDTAARIAAEMAAATPSWRRAAEPAVPAASSPASADDLSLITGVGSTYAQRLQEQGITTYAALAEASYEVLDEVTGGNLERVLRQDWRGQARRLAQEQSTRDE